jgi:aldose sugar dehydrogenase
MKIINTLRVGLIAASMVASGSLLAAAPSLSTELAVGKLELPWDMAFLKDGTMFFTEKCKGLSVRLP